MSATAPVADTDITALDFPLTCEWETWAPYASCAEKAAVAGECPSCGGGFIKLCVVHQQQMITHPNGSALQCLGCQVATPPADLKWMKL